MSKAFLSILSVFWDAFRMTQRCNFEKFASKFVRKEKNIRAKMGYHWIYWNVFFFCVSQYQENVMIFFDVLRIPQTFSPFAPFRFSRSGSLRPPLRPPLKGTPASASDFALLRSLRFISLTSKSLSGSAKVKKRSHICPDLSKQKKSFKYP